MIRVVELVGFHNRSGRYHSFKMEAPDLTDQEMEKYLVDIRQMIFDTCRENHGALLVNEAIIRLADYSYFIVKESVNV